MCIELQMSTVLKLQPFSPFSFAILFTLQTSRNEQEISRGSYLFPTFLPCRQFTTILLQIESL